MKLTDKFTGTLLPLLEGKLILLFCFLNGTAFGYFWEKMGTGNVWRYSTLGPEINGVPLIICFAWGIYSVMCMVFPPRQSTTTLKYLPFNATIMTFLVEPLAINHNVWTYMTMKYDETKMLLYIFLGWNMITITLHIINRIARKHITKQRSNLSQISFAITFVCLSALDAIAIYSILFMIYYIKLPPIQFLTRLLP